MFLERLFPEVKVSDADHQKWLDAFGKKVTNHVEELKTRANQVQENSSAGNSNDSDGQVEKLEKQVNHYKSVLVIHHARFYLSLLF